MSKAVISRDNRIGGQSRQAEKIGDPERVRQRLRSAYNLVTAWVISAPAIGKIHAPAALPSGLLQVWIRIDCKRMP